MSTSEQGAVTQTVEQGIATVEFSHPKSNSLPGMVLANLANTITDLSSNKDASVIVLKSKGEKAFCAGASFDELLSIADFEAGKEFFMGFARTINAMRKCEKLVICRVQGKAVGGGVGIASAADYTLATEAADIKLSELAIGIGPFVVGPAVRRKMGLSAFSTLSLNPAKWQSAEWARENGLYAEILPDIESLDEAVSTLARELSASNPEAMSMLKRAIWSGTEDWDGLLEKRAETSGRLVLSEFTANAINKFKGGSR